MFVQQICEKKTDNLCKVVRFMTILSGLHPLAVAAVGGVDCDLLALIDEKRNHHLGTGLKGDFLESVGRSGVTFDGGLGICDLKGDISGKLAGKAPLLGLQDEHHLNMLALFHEVSVFDDVVRQVDLLVCLLVHEVESVLIRIEELVRTPLDSDDVNLHSGGESVLKYSSVLEVAEFCLHESGALSGLDMLEINHLARLAIVADEQSVLEICCCCHILNELKSIGNSCKFNQLPFFLQIFIGPGTLKGLYA